MGSLECRRFSVGILFLQNQEKIDRKAQDQGRSFCSEEILTSRVAFALRTNTVTHRYDTLKRNISSYLKIRGAHRETSCPCFRPFQTISNSPNAPLGILPIKLKCTYRTQMILCLCIHPLTHYLCCSSCCKQDNPKQSIDSKK